MTEDKFKSYTSTHTGVMARLQEMSSAVRSARSDVAPFVAITIERLRDVEDYVQSTLGIPLEGLRILEIGPGQKLPQLIYFSLKNDVVGIDFDVVAQGFDISSYLKMLHVNGPLRTAKTVARKAIGTDRRFRQEFARQLGVTSFRRLPVLQMDAASMTFEDNSFDFAITFSVFEHLPDPGKVMEEMKRVIKPGGGFYISLHLWTSDNGCHDPRIFADERDDLPLWSHLRPDHAARIQPNAYLNKLRLHEWEALITDHLPGAHVRRLQYGRDEFKPEIDGLRAAGELGDYTDDELLTVDVGIAWRKP